MGQPVTAADPAAFDGTTAAAAHNDDENIDMHRIFGESTANSGDIGPDGGLPTRESNATEVSSEDWPGLLQHLSKTKQAGVNNVYAGWKVGDCDHLAPGATRFALKPDVVTGAAARVLTVVPQGDGSSVVRLYGRAQRPVPIDSATQAEIQHICEHTATINDVQYKPPLAPHEVTIRQAQIIVPSTYEKLVVMLLLERLAEGVECKCIDCEHQGPQKGEWAPNFQAVGQCFEQLVCFCL